MDRDLIIPFADYELEEDYDMHLFDQLNQMESIPMANDPHLFDLLEEQDPYQYPPPYNDPMDDAFIEQVTIHNHWCDEEGCNKVYSTKQSLHNHKRLKHRYQAVFPCDEPGCDKVFTTQDALDRHKGKHMRITPAIFPCDEPGCNKVYTNDQSLRYHKSTNHRDDRHFKCPVCHRVFLSANRNRHMRKMHKMNPYPCDECNMSFNKPAERTRHKNYEHRPHHCPYPGCGINILHYSKSQYLTHMQTHQNEKPFQCRICGKRFGRKDHVERHERTCNGPRFA